MYGSLWSMTARVTVRPSPTSTSMVWKSSFSSYATTVPLCVPHRLPDLVAMSTAVDAASVTMVAADDMAPSTFFDVGARPRSLRGSSGAAAAAPGLAAAAGGGGASFSFQATTWPMRSFSRRCSAPLGTDLSISESAIHESEMFAAIVHT